MGLFISEDIKRREFGAGGLTEEIREKLLLAARLSLGVVIAAPKLPRATRLVKSYVTTTQGHRRVVLLVMMESGDQFVIFWRDKKDEIGKNISPTNGAFVGKLQAYLARLAEDIAADWVEEIIAAPAAGEPPVARTPQVGSRHKAARPKRRRR